MFSKQLEWFQTVYVFIFVAKSAHLNNFVGLDGSPSSGQAGNCMFLRLSDCSVQPLYALWVIDSPAEMCFSVATLLLAEREVIWNWR